MLADLAVLSQDVFTVPLPELPKTTADITIVGGRVTPAASPAVPPAARRP
jgi:predicted amidohydrolase YtcJ